MDQARQILLGKWVFLSCSTTGQLFFMQGLGGTLTGQYRYTGSTNVQNITNVKIENESGVGILTFSIGQHHYKAMIHPVHKIMNGSMNGRITFNAYKI